MDILVSACLLGTPCRYDGASRPCGELARLEVLGLARAHRCTLAVLKERSPSCGRGQIHDGSFTGRLTEGSGVTARLLEEHGVQVYGESEAGTLAERGEAREEGQRAPCPLPSKYPGKND